MRRVKCLIADAPNSPKMERVEILPRIIAG
jgi:hypothetical protein